MQRTLRYTMHVTGGMFSVYCPLNIVAYGWRVIQHCKCLFWHRIAIRLQYWKYIWSAWKWQQTSHNCWLNWMSPKHCIKNDIITFYVCCFKTLEVPGLSSPLWKGLDVLWEGFTVPWMTVVIFTSMTRTICQLPHSDCSNNVCSWIRGWKKMVWDSIGGEVGTIWRKCRSIGRCWPLHLIECFCGRFYISHSILFNLRTTISRTCISFTSWKD